MAAFEAWLVFLIVVVNVVGELQRKRTLAASRGFLAAARLSCISLLVIGHRPESIRKWHNRKESLTNVVITAVCLARPVASNFQVGAHCKLPQRGLGRKYNVKVIIL